MVGKPEARPDASTAPYDSSFGQSPSPHGRPSPPSSARRPLFPDRHVGEEAAQAPQGIGPAAVVPEPSTLALAGIGAAIGAGVWWRRRRLA